MGLMGSAFGRALAGGGRAAADIASKYIDAEIERNRMEALADIQFKNNNRTRDANFAFENDPGNVAKRVDTASTVAKAAGRTAAEVDTERLSNPALNQAQRTKAAGDATAAQEIELGRLQNKPLIEAAREKAIGDKRAEHTAATEQTIADANNPELLGAVGKLKLADPEVAARIAASRAAAANAGAGAGLHSAQAEAVRLTIADKKKIDGLYDQAGKVLSDPTLDDATRAKEMAKVERQIVLMKSKNGQAAARDPELDTQTVVEEKLNPDGTTTKTTRKEVRRPGNGSQEAPADDPIKAAMDAARAARGGGGQGGQAGTAPTRKDPLTGADLTEREWDRKYGKGDFKQLYRRGEDSLKSF